MKKLLPLLLLILAAQLSACGILENEYAVISTHPIPVPSETEPTEEPIPCSEDSSSLRSLIMSFIREGSARNVVDVTGYGGDLNRELPLLLKRLQANSLYAYAVDYMDHDLVEKDGSLLLELNMVYRRSAEEISEIISVQGMEQVQTQIAQALTEFTSSLTLRVSGYRPMDYAQFIEQFFMEHPDLVVELPELTVALFPNAGSSRVLELHFGYSTNKTDMRNMQRNVSTLLKSVSNFSARGANDTERLSLLCQYLIGRTRYDHGSHGNQCAYSLLCRQEAGDCGFASVVHYIASLCEMECHLVKGTRDGVPYWWNIVCVDGAYRHIDMMQQWQKNAKILSLHTDAEMEGYEWDRALYPACIIEEEQEAEPEQSTPSSPDSSGPASSESSSPEPDPSQSESTESDVTEPESAEADPPEPDSSEPEPSEPDVSEPEPSP